MRSRFLDEIPAELLDEPAARLRIGGVGRGAGRRGSRAGQGAAPRPLAGASAGLWPFAGGRARRRRRRVSPRRGRRHAAFGEGVVTGVEPGGVIVVRFAGDGSERKLMAEYAPVSRR